LAELRLLNGSILEAGANLIMANNDNGQTPMDIVQQEGLTNASNDRQVDVGQY